MGSLVWGGLAWGGGRGGGVGVWRRGGLGADSRGVQGAGEDSQQAREARPYPDLQGLTRRMPMRTDVIDYQIIGDDIQAVVITLDPDEAMVAEAGAMMYIEDDIEMATSLRGKDKADSEATTLDMERTTSTTTKALLSLASCRRLPGRPARSSVRRRPST